MAPYMQSLRTALWFFPILALGLTIPLLMLEYRRYGALTFWRAFVVYTFSFYLLAAYLMVILPLPPRAMVAQLTTPRYNLHPLMVFYQFFDNTAFQWLQPHTWVIAIKQPGFTQPFFNLLLTVPFGLYLRYYFRRSFKQTLLLTFGLTCFFELTQLSALYGLYPRPYRLFDVDDLLINTAGGLLGYAIAPVLTWIFPSYQTMKSAAYRKGLRVSYTRRGVAFVIDWLVMIMALTTMTVFIHRVFGIHDLHHHILWFYLVTAGFYFVVFPFLTNGLTIGKWLVRIQIVERSGRAELSFWHLFIRQIILYGAIIPGLGYWLPRMGLAAMRAPQRLVDFYLLATLLTVTLAAVFAVHVLVSMLYQHDRLFYEQLSQTQQISTVRSGDSSVMPDHKAP